MPGADRLNVDGVARLLRVRADTVYSYVSRGVMPGGTICPCCGSGPTWDKAEIEQWQAARPGRTGRPKR